MSLIEIKNLIKTYIVGEEGFNALNGVSLTIKSGDFVSIMGPSGSGKSTFLNLLGCLDIPTSGTYHLNNMDVTHLSKNRLAEIRNKYIGFVFQGFNLLSRTSALDNVELPMIYAGISAKERKERASKILDSVGLAARKNHVPSQLSGGQQQRVAIARALVNDAPVIIADEPTGNLDSKTSQEIMELFKSLNEKLKKTIIIVTHEPEISLYGKRVINFQDGEIIKDTINNL